MEGLGEMLLGEDLGVGVVDLVGNYWSLEFLDFDFPLLALIFSRTSLTHSLTHSLTPHLPGSQSHPFTLYPSLPFHCLFLN